MRNLLSLLVVALLAVPAPGQDAAGDAAFARYSSALARDPSNLFYQYAVAQSARRLGLEPPAPPRVAPDRWRGQLYEMTTGAWAVQESLQLDRLAGGGDETGPSTVAIESVEGVATPSIPFAELMRGRTPVVEPLASAAPADWYYAHAPRVSALRRVLDAADRWGAHLLAAYAVTGMESRVRDRVTGQLLLDATPELDQFYDLAVGSVAVVGSDPFFREGSDVTVVMKIRNAVLFTAWMETQRRTAAVASRSRLSVLHERYRGWVVDGLLNADRSISSYVTLRDDTAIVSSSYAALRTVADVVDRLAPSMAASEDFQYMRSIKPYAEGDEDGFLFLSDAFVRRVVSPRLKIGEARRVRCAVSLQTAAYATVMFRTELGEPPGSIDDLVSRKYLDPVALRCPDGGRYALDGDVPHCSVHNRLRALTPNLELRLDRVAPEEVEAYAQFRENYKSYWRRYVDPVGVRARVRDGLEVEATILPLVENSAYSALLSAVGAEPVELSRPQAPDAIVTLDAKLPPAPEGAAAGSGTGLLGVDAGLLARALGDRVSVQVADGAPALTPAAAGIFGGLGGGGGQLDEWFVFAPLLAALTLPTAVVAPVRDRAALDEALARFRAHLASSGGGPGDLFELDGYQIVHGGARTLEAVTVRLLVLELRVYYAVVGDRFVVSTDRELLERVAAAPPTGAEPGALRLEMAPSRWNRILPAMALSYAEASRKACLENVSWIEALRGAYPRPPHELEGEALSLLGVALVCPDGGRYVAGGEGRVECALHGTPEAPRQGPSPQPGSPAAYLLEHVRRIEATLSFTSDGLSTRVRVQ